MPFMTSLGSIFGYGQYVATNTPSPPIPSAQQGWATKNFTSQQQTIASDETGVYTYAFYFAPNQPILYNYNVTSGGIIQQTAWGAIPNLGSGTWGVLTKYSSLGSIEWIAIIGGAVTSPSYISIGPSGNVTLACNLGTGSSGIFTTTLYFGNTVTGGVIDVQSKATYTTTGNIDGLILTYTSSGTLVWGASLTGTSTSNEVIGNVYVDSSDNVYVTGRLQPNTITINNFVSVANDGTPIQLTSFGQMSTIGGKQASILVKYNSSGSAQWSTIITNTTGIIITGFAIQEDSDGNILVGYGYNTSSTVFPVVYQFRDVTPGTPNIINLDVACTVPYITVIFNSLIVKYTPSGTVLMAYPFGGVSSNSVRFTVFGTNLYYICQQQPATLQLYNYNGLDGTNTVQLTTTYTVPSAQLTTGVNASSWLIIQATTSGIVQSATRIFMDTPGTANAPSLHIAKSPSGSIVFGAAFNNTTTNARLRIMNFGGIVGNDITFSSFGNTFITKSNDIILVKYNTSLQASWAVNINSGNEAGTQGETLAWISANSNYIFCTGLCTATTGLYLSDYAGLDGSGTIIQTNSNVLQTNTTNVNFPFVFQYSL